MWTYRSIAAATLATSLLAGGSPVGAQVVDPSGPQTVPAPKAHELAQAPSPDPCMQAVRTGENDKWLAVSRGVGKEYRTAAKVWLTKAGIAASQGDEQGCWRAFRQGEELKSP